jgi:hypothetical protein
MTDVSQAGEVEVVGELVEPVCEPVEPSLKQLLQITTQALRAPRSTKELI